ncbi:MAG: hydroxymethylbilane synthase [Campylobacterales bacterium]
MNRLVIATRGSKLALWQSEHIKSELERLHPGLKVELAIYKTTGDKILDTPLAKIGGKGLFTKELEEAMLAGDAHIAVHSLKDVPTIFPKGLVLAAVTKREDPRDAMLSEKYHSIDALPQGAVIGTTSLRRRMQLLAQRPDLVIKDLRGNVDTRIRKLKEGAFDAIILAAAGMRRLGLIDEVRYFVPIEIEQMIPAMGQAALGIEAVDNPEVLALIAPLNDAKAALETSIERAFIHRLEGGCQVPIAVHAQMDKEELRVWAALGLPDGSEVRAKKMVVPVAQAAEMGSTLADAFLEEGGREFLQQAERMAFG